MLQSPAIDWTNLRRHLTPARPGPYSQATTARLPWDCPDPGTVVARTSKCRNRGRAPKTAKRTENKPPMNHPALRLDNRQSQTLTPRLQYAVRLLQLSALDYEQELHDLMAKNPFLELDESAPRATSADADDATAVPTAEVDVPTHTESTSDHDDGPAWEPDSWNQDPGTSRDGAKESTVSATELMVADTDLHQYLRSQANLLRLSARDHALVCSLIESLDDDGYFRADLGELGAAAALDPVVDLCEMSTALRLVQSLEPAGVGARTVGECLILQIEKVDPAVREMARVIATDHLAFLAQRDVAGIAKLSGRPATEVDAACVALRRLDPRPGWRFSRPDTHYVTPDVVVRKLRGKWVVHLNSTVVPRLRLNRIYADLFQRHREASHGELGAHLQEARWTMRNVEQRFATILSVSQAILRRQYLFFEHGPLAMKPLSLRDIAQEVGIHESTVCRVTNNKYMATPGGLFELKQFFSRAMPMSSGGACSATAIRGVVKELIDAEDPYAPLSDVDIAQRLARQGLTVARRTVTKYRQSLKIAPADRRRAHAASIVPSAQLGKSRSARSSDQHGGR